MQAIIVALWPQLEYRRFAESSIGQTWNPPSGFVLCHRSHPGFCTSEGDWFLNRSFVEHRNDKSCFLIYRLMSNSISNLKHDEFLLWEWPPTKASLFIEDYISEDRV